MDICRASPNNHFKGQSKNIPRNITSPILPNKSRSRLAKQMLQLLKKMTTKLITTDEYPTYLGSPIYKIFRKLYLIFLCTVV